MPRKPDLRALADVPTILGAAAVGATASGGVVVERLTAGSLPFAAVATFVTAAATMFAMLVAQRATAARDAGRGAPTSGRACFASGLASLVLVQILGVAMGVGFVHAVLALLAPAPVVGVLAEAPAQLVNDSVLVGGLLLLMWSNLAASGRARSGLALAAFALVGLYRATAPAWHVDAIPFASLTVQHFVCVELATAAAALLAVFVAWPERVQRR